jgi:hypothetical protein
MTGPDQRVTRFGGGLASVLWVKYPPVLSKNRTGTALLIFKTGNFFFTELDQELDDIYI